MTSLPGSLAERVARAAQAVGTPAYVYDLDGVLAQVDRLRDAFGGRFGVSYAVKANPNGALLEALKGRVDSLDLSSGGELERALRAGWSPDRLTFSGPAKRDFELARASEVGVGEMVCESVEELDALQALGRPLSVLLRVNPLKVPKGFGAHMSGKASQFGIDEEHVDAAIDAFAQGRWPDLTLVGIHVYSASNSLDPDAISENVGIMAELFVRCAERHGRPLHRLIFGSGFGIPYRDGVEPLDVRAVAERVNPQVDRLREHPLLAGARCTLEMGRWLVGPNGWFVVRVLRVKHGRGTDIAICDGGMNNHLAACGLMGMVVRRNYPMHKVSGASGPVGSYTLVGPLCTTIDTLGVKVELAELSAGDLVAVGSSGAYGLTASPTGFISHPAPHEALLVGDTHRDITGDL
ncbi:MAG: type III PLP-dependent enzyme [Myxococcota bacterium]